MRLLSLSLFCTLGHHLVDAGQSRCSATTATTSRRRCPVLALAATPTPTGKRLLVLGGTGFVGREVCAAAVKRGYEVTSLSRRGTKPTNVGGGATSALLDAVTWVGGDATSYDTVRSMVEEADCVVHTIGALFDSESGLADINFLVSGSRSVPGKRLGRETCW